jgi:tripartite ATP-independent transporter DctM subunit
LPASLGAGADRTAREKDNAMIVAGYVGVLLVLFILAVPVAFALAGTSIIVTLMERGIDFNPAFMVQKAVSGIDNFMLLSVPFFIYAGKIMNTGGITVRIYAFAKSLIGDIRGGLAQVNVIASVIFAGMTGTAVSEAAGLGTVVIKSMKEEGYSEEFAVAVIGASSTIGPIIPPSVPLVIYALMANVSVGGILIAGFIPGLLMGLALMIWIAAISFRRGLPRGAPFSVARLVQSLKDGFLPLLTPVLLIGGIISGVFTPTEAAAIAALYATFLAMIVYREVGWRELMEVMRSTAVDTGVIMLIVAMAMIYGYLITRSGLTNAMVDWIGSISKDPIEIGLLIVVFLLIVGCFMEATAAIIILTPVLLPIMVASGLDPLHMGVIIVLTMMIGLLTPPFGMVLFVLARISGVPLHRVVVATAPFLIPLLIVDLILLFFPNLVLVLPRLIM